MNFYKGIKPEVLEEYAAASGFSGEEELDLVFFRNYITEGAKVLEVGCGSGRIGRELAKFTDYIGVDTNQEYLDYFRERSVDQPKLINRDFMDFDDEVEFDVVLFPWAVIWEYNTRDQIKAILHAKEILKKGGYIIIDTPTSDTEHNHVEGYNPTKQYYKDWLPELLKMSFKMVDFKVLETYNERKREITIIKK